MKAHVGDRIVIASRTLGGLVRDGEIVEVRKGDGGPPYLVRWTDDGHTGLFFPGVDAQISGEDETPGSVGAAGSEAGPTAAAVTHAVIAPRSRSWQVEIDLVEIGDATTAHAVLRSGAPEVIADDGRARRELTDLPLPEVGDEVAVARALRRLSDRLLEKASSEVFSVEGPHERIKS